MDGKEELRTLCVDALVALRDLEKALGNEAMPLSARASFCANSARRAAEYVERGLEREEVGHDAEG